MVPAEVCFRAFDNRFISTWRSCEGSPLTTTGPSGSCSRQRGLGAIDRLAAALGFLRLSVWLCSEAEDEAISLSKPQCRWTEDSAWLGDFGIPSASEEKAH